MNITKQNVMNESGKGLSTLQSGCSMTTPEGQKPKAKANNPPRSRAEHDMDSNGRFLKSSKGIRICRDFNIGKCPSHKGSPHCPNVNSIMSLYLIKKVAMSIEPNQKIYLA